MDDEIEKVAEKVFDGDLVFIPSHFFRALVASGVAVGAGGLSALAFAYAVREFKRTTVEEVVAMIKPPEGG